MRRRVVAKPIQSVQPVSFRKASRDMVNLIANAVQLVALLGFGYYLFKAVRADGSSNELLLWWTGITVLFCAGLSLFLEVVLLTGRAKILSAIETFGYILWLGSGYIGIPIIEAENIQAGLLKTVGILTLFLVWNGFQLNWGVSQLRAAMKRKHLRYEDLVEPAKNWARRRRMSPGSTTAFLEGLGKVVQGNVSRESVVRAWKKLETSSPVYQFLDEVVVSV